MLRRGSGSAASAIVSMESRPTSPAPRSSELSSLRSLQLSSSFRGDVHPDSTIVNPCSQARRQTGVASSELRRRVRIWRYVHRHQYKQCESCFCSVSRRKAATQRAYRRLTLVHIVNPCSCARSGTGVIRCTRHRAGRLPPHDPVYRPSGRALHPELPRPSRRRPSHSLGKHPVGRASMKAGNIVNPCSHVRSGDGCPQGRAQADRS